MKWDKSSFVTYLKCCSWREGRFGQEEATSNDSEEDTRETWRDSEDSDTDSVFYLLYLKNVCPSFLCNVLIKSTTPAHYCIQNG